MNLPGRIFSVGGAGKEIALELLESEWVLREILQPRPNPQTVRVTVLDTAEEEENSDRERIAEIREQVATLKSELRETGTGRPGDVTIEYKMITRNIQLNDQNDLIGEAAVPRITAGNGMDEDDWWVDEQHINENLDFATGVVRKRGLGKAMYYKAYAEDDELSTYIDLPDKGKVAVLAGLGGGTGSGIVIDLARHLQQKQRTAEITLFGILPNHTEGIRENANAYAALSELEYLNLINEPAFKDRILLPIDPTGFDGKGGNKIQNSQLLQEFDEAIVYLMAAYYNTVGTEDPFADSPTYAPFTIGIPQILRYNVEAINEGRTALRDILTAKEEAVQAERDIYAQIERFLDDQYGGPSGGGLRDLDRADLNGRLDDFRSLLDFELFNELEYESVSIFSEIVSDAEAESEDVSEKIDIISGSLRAVDTAGQQAGRFVDNIDETLAEVLEADLKAIVQRHRLLVQKQSIDDSRVRDAVEYLINSDDGSGNAGVKLNRLETQLSDIDDQRRRLEDELEETVDELETLQQQQADEVDRKVRDWERDVKPVLDQYQQIDIDAIESELAALTRELEQFRSEIVNARNEDDVDQLTSQAISQQLDDLETVLDRVGIDFHEQRTDIQTSLTALKETRKAFLTLNTEEGTLEKLTPWSGKTEQAKEEANRNYRVQKNKLDDRGVFSVGPAGGSFSADVEYDPESVITELRDRERDLEGDIVEELSHRLDEFESDLRREFESELDHGGEIERLRAIAQSAFEAEIEGTDELQDRKAELEAELEDLEAQYETYERTVDLFEELNQRREAYANRIAEFNRQRSEYDDSDSSTRTVATERDESVYVKNIKPNDVFRATGDTAIGNSDLFASREENQRVHSALDDLIENVFNEQYSGIKKRSFSKGRQRYNDIKVRVGVLSQAVHQIEPNALDFENRFNSAFDLGASGNRVENPYTSWQHDIGDSWDIGVSAFIDGIFLDNLRKMVQADGYRSGYEKRRSELDDDILIHHNHGLEDGFYVRRSEMLNMESDEDVGFYLQDEPDIVQGLLDEYVERIPVFDDDDDGDDGGDDRAPANERAGAGESYEYSGGVK
ncbi:tubulin-like doman-containing protein [Natrinema sp. HArc-T2]|uniref:tubulin-like doman-containing protein n=1 Tax=Natrinema sp. HArc-T2 TaxID=3242701 RepID=UPI00359EEEA7